MTLWIALAALLACNGSEKPASGPDTSPAPEAGAPKTPAETRAALESVWSWPEDKGPAPDVLADWEACGEQVRSASSRNVAGMAALQRGVRCMRQKGWERAPAR